ncbi:MarR family transcriptional regulator [Arthrobacter sp. NQ7]|uniref:MarR family transcriptional regulator n=1 Tax=Arthrobacter sp. NQ7 TaxID=3032303 RepID=UPI00240FB83E|nr:MarR family transcriptional regulator [Arthrobacter sp. NQ7]MDJ0458027.1 MarR family transcriptional regulator [Arthrobacter sp. NQ7]
MTIDLETSTAPGSFIRENQRIMHLLRKKATEALSAEGLSLDEWLVIDALTSAPQTMTDLADYLCITGPTLTRIIDRLVSKAFVYREVEPGDRRKVRVHIASRGKAAHSKTAEELAHIEDAVKTAHADA